MPKAATRNAATRNTEHGTRTTPESADSALSTQHSALHVFGIRHHGPGSARSVRRALEALQPDVILVEGPPDAAAVLPLLTQATMEPPVALLIYRPEAPQRAVYYPFAVFSPEWQAIHFGLTHNIPVRFMDLPQAHQLAVESRESRVESDEPTVESGEGPEAQVEGSEQQTTEESADNSELKTENAEPALPTPQQDPLQWVAEAAGYSDGERWWEHMVEQRQDSTDLFAAVLEVMTALREAASPNPDPVEAQREAHMRQTIRAAQREGFARIAVVCGAWHAPALVAMPPAADDAALLAGLPRVPVAATWVPWTYGRLAWTSGYGAGVESPGWYQHLWDTGSRADTPTEVTIRWLTRVAQLLRQEDLDASSAHIIEAVRLAESLAALRGRPLPGLPELNEAIQAVLLFGNDAPMRLIHEKLIVGERLGTVPPETPMVPLQADLQREQRRLRFPAEAAQRVLDLDLRKPTDLDRSRLLHRLALLDIPWGQPERTNGKGTFHEGWRVQWRPELAVAVIAAATWGNTVQAAATARAQDVAAHAPDLPALTAVLERALLADLPDAVGDLLTRLDAEAAVASDLAHLMEALPPLAQVQRYGNVRRTDAGLVGHVVDGLVARICIGLPGAVASLDDDAAAAMFTRLQAVHSAVGLLQNAEHQAAWYGVLGRLADQQGLHGLVAGRACRLLLDAGSLSADEAARRLGLALSTAGEPAGAAAWVEGFLKGSGLLLLHDATLWAVLDDWVSTLPADTFTALLPLLRRTFSTFTPPERRQMGERARRGPAHPAAAPAAPADFDPVRAAAVLPLVRQLLGIQGE